MPHLFCRGTGSIPHCEETKTLHAMPAPSLNKKAGLILNRWGGGGWGVSKHCFHVRDSACSEKMSVIYCWFLSSCILFQKVCSLVAAILANAPSVYGNIKNFFILSKNPLLSWSLVAYLKKKLMIFVN